MWAVSVFDVITWNVQSNLKFLRKLIYDQFWRLVQVLVCVSQYERFAMFTSKRKKANRSDIEIDNIIIEVITIKHFFSHSKTLGVRQFCCCCCSQFFSAPFSLFNWSMFRLFGFCFDLFAIAIAQDTLPTFLMYI